MAELTTSNLNKLVFPLADALQADLKLDIKSLLTPVEVTAKFPLVRVSLDAYGKEALTFKTKIVEALVDPVGVAALLVHVSGSLYFLLVNDTRGVSEITLYVLNGEDLPLSRSGRKERFLPLLWGKHKVLEAIAPGYVCSFTASSIAKYDGWTEVENGKANLLAYLSKKKKDAPGNGDQQVAVPV